MNDYGKPTDSRDDLKETSKPDQRITDAARLSLQGGAGDGQKSPEPPPDHRPAYAHGDIGSARRVETWPEKSEVKRFGLTEEEVKKKAQPPEGWRPGGPEHGG